MALAGLCLNLVTLVMSIFFVSGHALVFKQAVFPQIGIVYLDD